MLSYFRKNSAQSSYLYRVVRGYGNSMFAVERRRQANMATVLANYLVAEGSQ